MIYEILDLKLHTGKGHEQFNGICCKVIITSSVLLNPFDCSGVPSMSMIYSIVSGSEKGKGEAKLSSISYGPDTLWDDLPEPQTVRGMQ